MKQISESLRTHLAQEVMTLAGCWKLTRRDGVAMGFTNHDTDIAYAGVTYVASAAVQASAVSSSLGLASDNYDLEGVLQADAITEEDLLAGLYDYAEIEYFMLNYADTASGPLHMKTGWLGEVTLQGQQFVAEVRGIADVLQRTVGEHFSPACRALLGDARCGVTLAHYTVTGTIEDVTDQFTFSDSTRTEEAGYYDYGIVTCTSGANQGVKREVKRFAGGSFTSFQEWPYAFAIGDNYEAIAGCNKQFNTCVQRFQNAVNFRGEPHVPGTDAILETSSTRNR